MKKVWTVLGAVALALGVWAVPAAAKSNKPDGVPTGMWIDYCDHNGDLVAALDVIGDEPNSPDSFVDDEFTGIERSLRRDAKKLAPKNAKFAKQVLVLAKAVAKTRDDWASDPGQLKLRALSIAADPMPEC